MLAQHNYYMILNIGSLESLLKETLQVLPDGVLVTNETRKTLFFNQKLVDMWGVPLEVIASNDSHKAIGCDYAKDNLKDPVNFIKIVHQLQGNLESREDKIEFKDGRG